MAGGDTGRGRASGEHVIAAAFAARGVRVVDHKDWRKRLLPGEVVVKGFPYTTVYRTTGALDFVLLRDHAPAIALEIKHQNVSGSCDEKLPYVMVNALYQWPAPHGILILSGDHFAGPRGLAAITAMRDLSAALAVPGRHFDVFDMTQGLNFIARSF
jgi:hypothetical protein